MELIIGKMKCSICGKEFGDGINCQNCGVDRVTGLANYSGHEPSIGNYHSQGNYSQSNSSYNEDNTSLKTMVCYACGEIIPINSEYCPHCRKKLYETCPKCGNKFSSQYLNCNQCGTNMSQYLEEERERERKEKIEEQNRAFQEHIMLTNKKIYQKEAQELRDSYDSPMLRIILSILFIGVLLLLFFYYIKILPLIVWLCIIIPLGLCCPLIAASINESVIDSKMRKWKQEHPNDPRSKYL